MAHTPGNEVVDGSASTVVRSAPIEVFDAIADIERMGEWSPECVGCSWVSPATGPTVGARFEGHNAAKLGPITLKKWSTMSEVTACIPGQVFEFITESHSTWRYEFAKHADGTVVTESFSYPQYVGKERFLYETLGRRSKTMVGAVEATLARTKMSVEGQR